MATKPLSAAEMEKVKNYLMGNALKGGTGSGIPYSPEFIEKMKETAAKVKPKAKAAKGLLSAKPLEPTGLLQSSDTEFTTDNVNPYVNTFTQDAMGPTTQETISAAKHGVRALPSAVPTVEGDPNIAVSQTAPRSKEVTHTTKPDGTEVKKIKETVDTPKAAKPTASNGDLIPADAIPKTNHNMPPVDVNAAPMGPAEAPKEGMPIPDDNPYALPEKYRFDPTAPPVPIVAQYPAQMPAIPEGRLTNTEGLIPAENTATQGLTTNISALAPLPKEEEERFAALRDQRLGQISDNEAAARDFTTSYQPRTDMSALLSFIGSQLGRDYLKGYQKPAGLGDLVGMQDKLEENIAKAKTGLSDTDMQYLKARMGLQDSQKTKEEMTSTLRSLQLAQLKAAAGDKGPTTQQDREYYSKAQQAYTNAGRENPGEGARIDAFKKIVSDGAEINRIVRRAGGRLPNPASKDYDLLNSIISRQLTTVNNYEALLGALSKDDQVVLKEAIGFSQNTPGWLKSLLPDKRRGILEAIGRFQEQVNLGFKDADEQARAKYSGDFPETAAPNVMLLHAPKVKEYTKARKAYLATLINKTSEQKAELYELLTDEEKAVADKAIKGGKK